jgi:hypothetical protein
MEEMRLTGTKEKIGELPTLISNISYNFSYVTNVNCNWLHMATISLLHL